MLLPKMESDDPARKVIATQHYLQYLQDSFTGMEKVCYDQQLSPLILVNTYELYWRYFHNYKYELSNFMAVI